ncbi:DUF3392 family protein [Pseudoalteromonas spongiae]|uniref:DUF3392 family protein n=1 Tax=Pseudoalteromonas spongiae TaxID=298657 RepID=UPI00110A5925|nr:DUF3392 family protein [Pseudoalteromonas spongiae]TMO86102.1 DUF3392 domain-containing protein [Pseudoalteromonas spongiae]
MSEFVNMLSSFNSQVATWLAPYLSQIVLIALICLTSVYGASLNKAVKRLIGQQNFVARTFVFILVTGVGIGSLIVFVSPYLVSMIKQIDRGYLPLTVLLLFVVLGALADRKNQV